jgi:hypothetical protein
MVNTKNPIIDGSRIRRVTKKGHRILKYARKSARELENKGYSTIVVRDKISGRYFVYRTFEN